jgi:hypothetical protein
MDRQFRDIIFANSLKITSCRLFLHPHHPSPSITARMALPPSYRAKQYRAIGNQPAYITTANSRRFTMNTMKQWIYYSHILLMVATLVHNDVFAFQNPHPSAVGGLLARGTSTRNSPSATSVRHPFHHQQGHRQISILSPLLPSSVSSSATALFGIPKMFRWLTDQYPNILNRRLGSASSIPPIDNFYLDMNGIIHPCTHGNNEDEITILDETEMFKKIFGYVDRLYKIVQPKKVLYLAVDGVSIRFLAN